MEEAYCSEPIEIKFLLIKSVFEEVLGSTRPTQSGAPISDRDLITKPSFGYSLVGTRLSLLFLLYNWRSKSYFIMRSKGTQYS